jgi:hypothetical protein
MELDYESLIVLDAEDLAEGGIKQAYETLLPHLREYVAEPLSIEERLDVDAPSYAVVAGGTEYVVYGPGVSEENSWARATFILFRIVNDQLAHADHRLYAINGGNDLGGMLLTQSEAEDARRSLPNPTDWPYLPDDSDPWCGQFH